MFLEEARFLTCTCASVLTRIRICARTFYHNTKISRAIHVHRINMQSNLPNISIEHLFILDTFIFSHPLSVQSSCGTIVKKKKEKERKKEKKEERMKLYSG